MASLLFLLDDRVSRERISILLRNVAALKQKFNVELIKDIFTEDDLIKRMETTCYDLVLLPWHRYLDWNKPEAYYGLTRTSGPTVAGYFSEPTKPSELTDKNDFQRSILIDFSSLTPAEAVSWVTSLSKDTLRTGLQPLLEPSTPIYRDFWTQSHEAGSKCDLLLSQITRTTEQETSQYWSRRSPAIRICFHALWDLAFESKSVAHPKGRADFQVGIDSNTVALRVVYSTHKKTAKEVLKSFWPDASVPLESAQLLLKYGDSFRAHFFPDSGQIELVVTFTKSAASEVAHLSMHTYWVEPLSAKLLSEIPFENSAHSKPLSPSGAHPAAKATPPSDKFVTQAIEKIRELRKILLTKDDLITELRSGGVGTSQPLSPPDTDALLEAFQQRYFDTRFQIRQLEHEVTQLEAAHAQESEIESIRIKVAKLTAQETIWIKKLAGTLDAYRKAKKKA